MPDELTASDTITGIYSTSSTSSFSTTTDNPTTSLFLNNSQNTKSSLQDNSLLLTIQNDLGYNPSMDYTFISAILLLGIFIITIFNFIQNSSKRLK